MGGRCEAPQPAYRGVTSAGRTAAAEGIYIELDVAKCWPSLMMHLAVAAGITAPCLFEYARTADAGKEVLQGLTAFYCVMGRDVATAAIKKAINSFAMGGGVPAELKPAPGWLWEYKAEVDRIREASVAAFLQFLQWARGVHPKRSEDRLRTSAFARLLQALEDASLFVARDSC